MKKLIVITIFLPLIALANNNPDIRAINQQELPLHFVEPKITPPGLTSGTVVVRWQNTGDKDIVAYQVEFLRYNPWNQIIEPINTFTEIQTIESKENGKSQWTINYSPNTWITVFYISKIRFADDTIVTAKSDYIISKIAKYLNIQSNDVKKFEKILKTKQDSSASQ